MVVLISNMVSKSRVCSSRLPHVYPILKIVEGTVIFNAVMDYDSGVVTVDEDVRSVVEEPWAESEAPVVTDSPDAPEFPPESYHHQSPHINHDGLSPAVLHMLLGVQHVPCHSSPPTCVGAEFLNV
ncbi:hypothetical protein Tco_1176079 [Tanacetum coccineum]